MSRFPKLLKAAAALASLALLVFVHGCTMGFTNLHPGENSGLYASLFEDILNTYDEPHWLWVRGTISGDLNGNGVVDEEVVLATIQKGDARNPGPIEVAFLVACRVEEDGKRTAIARTLLFDKSPIAGAPMPVNDLGIVDERSFTRCRAQMVQDKATLTETVVAYFWSESRPCSVWYVGFALNDGRWEKNLESVMWQTTPGFLTANLDRSIDASPFGYQLLFSVSAIPEQISAKLGPPHEAPLWGHVFARNSAGYYGQADERFADNYRQLEGPWNQTYLKAVINGLPPEELAWYEYHLGILNHYTGHPEMACGFLKKARRHAADPVLQKAVAAAVERIGVDKPPAVADTGTAEAAQ